MKASVIYRALRTLVAAKQPVFIWGGPGIGKSAIVRRLAADSALPLQDVLRRQRHMLLPDSALLQTADYLRRMADEAEVGALTDSVDATYSGPPSAPTALIDQGIPLDKVEDLLSQSAAYRQASRILIREHSSIKGRRLTPLHRGHVSLLATAGMLNGVFGQGEERHIAHWRSVKFIDHWEESEPNGTLIKHDRERFSHELSLVC